MLRVVLGLMALDFTAMGWGSPMAMGAGMVGAMLSLTGLVGFCPMCALLGRKLHKGP
ncbi:YgaP family membrane protein [Curvibacter gracilis]|uniref:YgaP family membrane protein n=1 Tax=Curvibacter gracilis TaxID=230310 RepID=UPI001FE1E568|nr:DUF2892 domain-containing protein [Curvibacter gracilis]